MLLTINSDTESTDLISSRKFTDFLRAHESKANTFQQLYYAAVLPAVIQGWLTTGGMRQNIGVAANYDGDIWNISTFVYAMFVLPRLQEEKNEGGKTEAFIFWATALFNAFVLLPATLACFVSVTVDAKKIGDCMKTFWASDSTLGNNAILFSGQLAYALSMTIATLDQINRYQKSEVPYQRKISCFKVMRDGSCAVGAFFAAASMLLEEKFQETINTVSFACYILTIGMNLGELLGKYLRNRVKPEAESVVGYVTVANAM